MWSDHRARRGMVVGSPRAAGYRIQTRENVGMLHLEEDAAKNLHGYAEGLSVIDRHRGRALP